jgi:hypothetical protein
MYRELEREQLNLESIQSKAIEYAEQDQGRDNARELDQDWLFRVADLAQKISDKDVQELWARAVSSAAVKGGTLLSSDSAPNPGPNGRTRGEGFQKLHHDLCKPWSFPKLACEAWNQRMIGSSLV